MRYTKADVQFHTDGYGREMVPAVNVKHRPDLEREVNWADFEGAEFKAWALAELDKSDVAEIAWQVAAESCWDMVQTDAEGCWPSVSVVVESQGRQGGWAVVNGLKNFDSWDAIDLAAWRKFERYATQDAKDMAYQMVSFLYLNVWDGYRYAVSAGALALVGA